MLVVRPTVLSALLLRRLTFAVIIKMDRLFYGERDCLSHVATVIEGRFPRRE